MQHHAAAAADTRDLCLCIVMHTDTPVTELLSDIQRALMLIDAGSC